MAADLITAHAVYEAACARYEHVGAEQLGTVYQGMLDPKRRDTDGIFYTPEPLAQFTNRLALTKAIEQVGPGPDQLLRVVVCDPACGVGIFLVTAARQLSVDYAARLAGGDPDPTLVWAVMPTVILACIYGIEIDPVAVELARLSLSLATGRLLPDYALTDHVVCANTLDGPKGPPAMERRSNLRAVDVGPIGADRPPRAAAAVPTVPSPRWRGATLAKGDV
jgi:MmeI, DNA-methyltransferase domain